MARRRVGGPLPTVISLAECRALLGNDAPESDRDVEALRDLVYALSLSAIESASEEARERAEQEAS